MSIVTRFMNVGWRGMECMTSCWVEREWKFTASSRTEATTGWWVCAGSVATECALLFPTRKDKVYLRARIPPTECESSQFALKFPKLVFFGSAFEMLDYVFSLMEHGVDVDNGFHRGAPRFLFGTCCCELALGLPPDVLCRFRLFKDESMVLPTFTETGTITSAASVFRVESFGLVTILNCSRGHGLWFELFFFVFRSRQSSPTDVIKCILAENPTRGLGGKVGVCRVQVTMEIGLE